MWGELAGAAAERAGLCEPDVEELRGHLDDQCAIDEDDDELPRAVIRA